MRYTHFIALCIMFVFLGSCKPVTISSKSDLSNAGIDTVAGAIVSSSTATIGITGISISSPTINIITKAFEKNNSPIIKIESLEVTIFRNQSRSSFVNYFILGCVVLLLILTIIHIRNHRRIR
jgi:hypothetical protein